jgi:hypothetical protein
MKSFIYAAVAATILAAPALSFAQQSTAPVTRAEVRAELVALEKAGYNPNDWINYPENLQAAQQRVDAERIAQAHAPAVTKSASAQSSVAGS